MAAFPKLVSKSNERVNSSDDSDQEDGSFTVPKGYNLTKEMGNVNLRGKKIILFRVPKGTSLSSVKELPVSLDKAGETTIKINNAKYKLRSRPEMPSSSSSNISDLRILLPDNNGKLKINDTPVSAYCELSRKVEIPKIDYSKVIVAKPKISQPRIDPRPESIGDAISESPKLTESTTTSNNIDVAQTERKKVKKRKHSSHHDGESHRKEKKIKKDKKDKKQQ